MTMEDEAVSPEVLAARARMRERLGNSQQQLGGKGTARRKNKKVHKSVANDDKKLQQTLKRIGVANINSIDQVDMIMSNGKMLQFLNPKVQASPHSHTYVVAGHCEEKPVPPPSFDLQSLLGKSGLKFDPNSITPDVLKKLQKHVEESRVQNATDQTVDEEVPELVENFEDVSNK